MGDLNINGPVFGFTLSSERVDRSNDLTKLWGYVPGLSIITGIGRIDLALRGRIDGDLSRGAFKGNILSPGRRVAQFVRGAAEFSCVLGPLLFIIDLIVTLAQRVFAFAKEQIEKPSNDPSADTSVASKSSTTPKTHPYLVPPLFRV